MSTTTTATAPATKTYEIDKAHSEAVFQVRHLLTRVRGRFSLTSAATTASCGFTAPACAR